MANDSLGVDGELCQGQAGREEFGEASARPKEDEFLRWVQAFQIGNALKHQESDNDGHPS
jgi:hypothetical protein